MSVGAAPLPPDFFSTVHDSAILFALAVIGAITVAVMIAWVFFRALGDIYEEYCNFRRRCVEAKRRLRQEIGAGSN